MSKRIHLSVSISGALRNPKEWVNCFTVGGELLTTVRQVKEFLEYQLALGHKLLPTTECEGFSYETGCPGHLIEEASDESDS